jgi:hypothetical protein
MDSDKNTNTNFVTNIKYRTFEWLSHTSALDFASTAKLKWSAVEYFYGLTSNLKLKGWK